ncbi:hypothetical protein AB4Z52_23775 [Rhizobium sp. 2YAF20]|uniref:hypothetical protein n=1 Tax=Rhizobium sp. 2YAF20 TaxID=3233027 RepID=UPI003F945F98
MIDGFNIPASGVWTLLVLVSLSHGIADLLQITAFSKAPASIIIPLQYSQITIRRSRH